ncbi:Hsp70 family protein [Micromonospora sp. C28SCA-DRY-2]|uniref:Hsp70 family protein n=1 Tax=Micromonospora sp. C28SCA-DRY-2 TaxID=3059522 RepID=UPI002675FC17|nr:Hsp70 family protein [Micromonospora sp. C28SCA-DRY-2]MDO3702053.1 Hsp70 family protein [Micromonospora sp. C28SCA-DRY-2]
MAGQHEGYALGVDLGTSNTVAVLRRPDGQTRPLLVDGQPIIPSGVYADADGVLHAGRDAQRLARTEPGRYEPHPKRRIDEPAVALGDRRYPPAELLAATLHAVARAAVEAVGFLPPAVLTCPATWDAPRRQVLSDALALAGWPSAAEHTMSGPTPPGTRLLREPVAAARYYTQVLRRPVPVGGVIAVFDFGAGTLDVAVLRNEGADPWGDSGFTVVTAGGAADLGGLDVDAALFDRLGELVAGAHPGRWAALTRPESTTQWRERHQLWENVRGAKEMLSRAAVAPVAVPGVEAAVPLTRDDLERVATPLLRRAVAVTREVLDAAGLHPQQLAGLFLVGGATRTPLVARLLHAELGVAPTVLEQPELPVAEGALTDLPLPRPARVAAGFGAPALAPPPVPPVPPGAAPPIPTPVSPPGDGPTVPAAPPAQTTPAAPHPVSPAAPPSTVPAAPAPGQAPPTVPAAHPTSPAMPAGPAPRTVPAQPTSPATPPSVPAGGAPAQQSLPATPGPAPTAPTVPAVGAGAPPAATLVGPPPPPATLAEPRPPIAGAPGVPAAGLGWPGGVPVSAAPVSPPPGGPGLFRRRAVWITLGAVLALAGVTVAAVLYLTRDRYPGLEWQNPVAEVNRVPAGEERPTEMFTAVLDDRGYLAHPLPDGRLEVVAIDTRTGGERWRRQVGGSGQRWDRIVALPGAVAVFADATSSDTPRDLIVLDGASGDRRWDEPIRGDDDVLFAENVAVLVDRTLDRLVGLRLDDGAEAWTLPNPRDEYGGARTNVYRVTTDEALGGPAYPNGTPRDPWRGDARRIVQVGADRSVRLIDTDTGTVIRTRAGAADLDDLVMAHGDRLYVADDESRYQLLAYDLTSDAKPELLYTAGDGRRPEALVPCGERRVCLLEVAGGDAKTAELVAVTEERAERWPAPEATVLVPLGEHVLARRTSPESASTLFGPDGPTVLKDRDGVAVRIDAGNLLVFADRLSSVEDDRSVAGVPVSSGRVVELGQLKDVRSDTCSWNTAVVVCGAEKDYVLYRFAEQ